MSTKHDRYAGKAYRCSRDARRAEHAAMDMRDARAEITTALLDRFGIGATLAEQRPELFAGGAR